MVIDKDLDLLDSIKKKKKAIHLFELERIE
jgi:hypothetical protein